MNEILLGAGEVYMYAFSGAALPDHAIIETAANNVGHCSGGFSITYKPTKYEVKNQYGNTVKSFITKESISVKTGILSWDLAKLSMLSTAQITESGGSKTLTFGGGNHLATVLVRFVHTKADGKKVRFTMIGEGGSGFSFEFGEKELSIDSELTAVEQIPGFLASFEEEV